MAVGPISGIPAPNTGKTIVAAKSPATGGYGDGNLGTRVTDQIRKAGYDALIVEGRADSPTMLVHRGRPGRVPAGRRGLGQGHDRDQRLDLRHATARASGSSTSARAARTWSATPPSAASRGAPAAGPGMGAVMGSKLLKAIVVKGSKPIPQAFPAEMKALGRDDLQGSPPIDKEAGWSIQGTDRRAALVQRGRGPPGPQLPGHPPPGRLDGRRRAGQRGAGGHLRLPELHDALRHRHPRRGGSRVRDRLREHRPPRAEPRPLRPGRSRRPQLPVRRLRPGHDLGRQRARASTPTRSSRAPSRATSASATRRASSGSWA